MGMRQGEVWRANQPEPVKRRPVALLSQDKSYRVRTSVIAAQVTTTIFDIPTQVFLDEKDGPLKKCAVNLDTITMTPKSLLSKRISALTPSKMAEVEEAIKFVLALK